jgi:hypothetical protein
MSVWTDSAKTRLKRSLLTRNRATTPPHATERCQPISVGGPRNAVAFNGVPCPTIVTFHTILRKGNSIPRWRVPSADPRPALAYSASVEVQIDPLSVPRGRFRGTRTRHGLDGRRERRLNAPCIHADRDRIARTATRTNPLAHSAMDASYEEINIAELERAAAA